MTSHRSVRVRMGREVPWPVQPAQARVQSNVLGDAGRVSADSPTAEQRVLFGTGLRVRRSFQVNQ